MATLVGSRAAGIGMDPLMRGMRHAEIPSAGTQISRGGVACPGATMGEVVQHGTAWLTPEDRSAIAVYLLDEGAPLE